MNIFKYASSSTFMSDLLISLGRGSARRIADHLGISTSLVSQITQGKKVLTVEQAYSMSTYLAHSAAETEYLIFIVLAERGGTQNLKKFLKNKAVQLAKEHISVEKKFKANLRKSLSEEQKAIFYSSWRYSAVRQMIATLPTAQAGDIALKLHISIDDVVRIVRFLLDVGLIEEAPQGFRLVEVATHIGANHPLVKTHHMNWRMQAVERSYPPQEGLHFTGPMSIQAEDMQIIRDSIQKLLEQVKQLAHKDSPDHACCLNIDLFTI